MSFPKAKRFAEPIASVAPAVGSYDPKPLTTEPSIALDRSERFRISKEDTSCSSTSSIDSIQSNASAIKIPRSRSLRVPMSRMKYVDQEMEIRRLLNERSRLTKELESKENDIIKLEGKFSNAIKEKTRIQSNATSLENEVKELRKANDVLRAKINVLDRDGKRKDIQMQLANAESQLVSRNHVITDLRVDVANAKAELESITVKLSEREDEVRELRTSMAKEIQDANDYSVALEERNLSLETTQEVAVEQLDEMESTVAMLEDDKVKLQATIQELETKLDLAKQEREAQIAEETRKEKKIMHEKMEEASAALLALQQKSDDSISRMQSDLDACSIELASSTEKIEALESQLILANLKNNDLTCELKSAQDEINHLAEDILLAKTERETMTVIKQKLENDIANYEAETGHLERVNQNLSEQLAAIVGQLEQSKTEVADRLECTLSELNHLKEQKKLVEENLQQATQQLVKSEEVRAEQLTVIEEDRHLLDTVKVELASMTLLAEERLLQLDCIKEQKKICEDQLEMTQQSLSELQDTTTEQLQSIAVNCKQLEDLKTELVATSSLAEDRLEALKCMEQENGVVCEKMKQMECEILRLEQIRLEELQIVESDREITEKLKVDLSNMTCLAQERLEALDLTKEERNIVSEKLALANQDLVRLEDVKSEQLKTIETDKETLEKLRVDLEGVTLLAEERLETVVLLKNDLKMALEQAEARECESKLLIEESQSEIGKIKSELMIKCEELETTSERLSVARMNEKDVLERLERVNAEQAGLESALERSNVQLQSAMEQLEIALEQYAAERKSGEQERCEHQDRQKRYETELMNLGAHVKYIQKAQEESESNKKALLEQLQVAYYDMEQLDSRMKTELEKCRKDTSSELAVVKEQLSKAEAKITMLTASNATLTAEVESNKTISEDMKMTSDELERVLATCNTQQSVMTAMQADMDDQKNKIQTLTQENQRHRANSEWFHQREKDLLREINSMEEKSTDKIQDLQRLLAENHKKQIQLELELKRQRSQREKDGRHNEEMLQSLTDQYESRIHNLAKEAKGCYEHEEEITKWKTMCQELQAKIEPFQEQLDMFEIEKKALLNQKTDAQSDLVKLSVQYAKLLGHQNQKQKIHHIMKLKEETLTLKQENCKLTEQVLKMKKALEKDKKPMGSKQPASAIKTKENASPLVERNHS